MKIIFITGVSTGIGYDAFTKLHAMGYYVVGTVRKKEDAERLSSKKMQLFSSLMLEIQKNARVLLTVSIRYSQSMDSTALSIMPA